VALQIQHRHYPFKLQSTPVPAPTPTPTPNQHKPLFLPDTRTSSSEIIIDDLDSSVQKVGSWVSSVSSANFYGPDYIHNNNEARRSRLPSRQLSRLPAISGIRPLDVRRYSRNECADRHRKRDRTVTKTVMNSRTAVPGFPKAPTISTPAQTAKLVFHCRQRYERIRYGRCRQIHTGWPKQLPRYEATIFNKALQQC